MLTKYKHFYERITDVLNLLSSWGLLDDSAGGADIP